MQFFKHQMLYEQLTSKESDKDMQQNSVYKLKHLAVQAIS